MATSRKILHYLEGIGICLIFNWILGHLFSLANVTSNTCSPSGKTLGIVTAIIPALFYWFLRDKYPYVAKGVLMGAFLGVLGILLGTGLLCWSG